MRRSFLEALTYTRGRIAFGRPLAKHPLMRRQLVDLLIEAEGCAALAFETITVLERVDRHGVEEDRRLLRILTPLRKYYIPKRGEREAQVARRASVSASAYPGPSRRLGGR
ncbi:MAG: hypothetical protein NVS4B7_15670 [Ktedonobacteraceae bacterium]